MIIDVGCLGVSILPHSLFPCPRSQFIQGAQNMSVMELPDGRAEQADTEGGVSCKLNLETEGSYGI